MADDKPLKHDVEKVDAVNEIALVWVRVPQVRGGVSSDAFWMYYGNGNAPDGSDGKGLYVRPRPWCSTSREGEALPQDATAYATNAADSKAQPEPAGWIGAAARFNGAGGIAVNATPQLAVNPKTGWSFTTWVASTRSRARRVLQASDGNNGLDLVVNGVAALRPLSG